MTTDEANQGRRLRPLHKHFPYELDVSGGGIPIDLCVQALGAFFLENSGYPTGGTTRELVADETFEFTYRGRVWRAGFILVYDMQAGRVVPFRIDFDYIRQAP